MCWVLVLSTRAGIAAKVNPADVPTFQLRVRVTSAGGQAPGERKFALRVGSATAAVTGGGWSGWLAYDRAAAEQTLKGYPAMYMDGFPVVTALSVSGVIDPTAVQAELKLDETGQVIPLTGELFGPNLGILIWRDEGGKPRAATQAQYNRRYWKELEGVRIPEGKRPKHFPITDRFIGGDDDRANWRVGIEALSQAGFSAIMLPPSKAVREIALNAGVTRTAWAVYSPPGYAFDAAAPRKDGKKQDPPQSPEAWARALAKQYTDAGWDVRDVAAFAMSDEPGWYYPATLKLADDPAVLARFHEYLKSQGLKPADVGAADWDEVKPIGRSGAKGLPSKRLFYWSMRFFPHDSARYFADCTRAMESAFYPGIPVTTNWNFFSGRFYVPGPVANNGDKSSPDGAMGGHDWLEFGRMRGSTMLWTEDWFPDAQAYQWSFYCAKLRCAAEKGGVRFGGYVVPRVAGDREDGILQKVMCLVGSGGKAVKFFVFGPEYAFPGNCYSERPGLLKKIAEANAMIGAAEGLLWEGKRPKPQVAILMPKSSQVWDLKDMPVAEGIEDATNTNLAAHTMDYMAEVFGLYVALQHLNIPVDFVEEEDLTADGLKDYRLVYVTEPNVPEEGQRGLVEWVKGGGTLVTVTGAAARDRYDEPCTVLGDATGIREEPRERMPVPDLASLKEFRPAGSKRGWASVGPRGKLVEPAADRHGTRFEEGVPPVVQQTFGDGHVAHFTFMPGLSYLRSASRKRDRLPSGFDGILRDYAACVPSLLDKRGVGLQPVTASVEGIETPILLSDKGAAITALNWTGQPVEKLELKFTVPFQPRTAEAVQAGRLEFQQGPGRTGGEQRYNVKLSLPVKSVDVIMVRP